MELAIEILTWTVAVPAAISMAVLFSTRRFLANRYSGSIAFCAGLMSGYALLDWARLVPERHYQWIPWLPLVGLIPAALSLMEKARTAERVVSFVPLSAATAFFIVPTWSRLDDFRSVYLVGVTITTWLLCCVLDVLASRMRPAWFMALVAICLGSTAGIVMPFLSLKFGQLLLCATGAATGIGILAIKFDETNIGRTNAPLLASVLTCGSFIAFVDPDPVEYAYLTPLCVPLVCVLFVLRKGSAKPGFKIAVLQLLLTFVIIGSAGWWTYSQQSQQSDGYGDYGY